MEQLLKSGKLHAELRLVVVSTGDGNTDVGLCIAGCAPCLVGAMAQMLKDPGPLARIVKEALEKVVTNTPIHLQHHNLN
jgi:hypothetical protein